MIKYRAEISGKNRGYQISLATDGIALDVVLGVEGNVRAATTLTPKEVDSLISSLQAARIGMPA